MYKKFISIILIITFALCFASCSEDASVTINSDGSSFLVADVFLSEDEYVQYKEMFAGKKVDKVVKNGKTQYKCSESYSYKTIAELSKKLSEDFETVNVSVTDFYAIVNESSTEMSGMTPASINLYFTTPYNIVKTNGSLDANNSKKVKFTNIKSGQLLYYVTDKSTATWTKASDISKEIKTNITKEKFKNTKVPNFAFALKKTKKTIVLKNKGGYMIMNGKQVFNDPYNATALEVFRKVNKAKWKKVKTINFNKKVIRDNIYTDKAVKKGKTYQYKIRGVYKVGNLKKYSKFSKIKKIKY